MRASNQHSTLLEAVRLARDDVAHGEQGTRGFYARELVALEEQLEAHRKALVALIGWSDGDNGDDFGTTEWANARALVTNPASERRDD